MKFLEGYLRLAMTWRYHWGIYVYINIIIYILYIYVCSTYSEDHPFMSWDFEILVIAWIGVKDRQLRVSTCFQMSRNSLDNSVIHHFDPHHFVG